MPAEGVPGRCLARGMPACSPQPRALWSPWKGDDRADILGLGPDLLRASGSNTGVRIVLRKAVTATEPREVAPVSGAWHAAGDPRGPELIPFSPNHPRRALWLPCPALTSATSTPRPLAPLPFTAPAVPLKPRGPRFARGVREAAAWGRLEVTRKRERSDLRLSRPLEALATPWGVALWQGCPGKVP